MDNKIAIFFFSIFTIFLLSVPQAFSGGSFGNLDFPETDSSEDTLAAFFDLRDRETYIQVTNTGNDIEPEEGTATNVSVTVHVQIFNVADNCNENNFFDNYTPADTHVYNMRDILRNDGSPSGVVLPDGAYGIVMISTIDAEGNLESDVDTLIGNIRMLDNSGYEYRTNIAGDPVEFPNGQNFGGNNITFNFNTAGGVTLTDVIGFTYVKRTEDGEVDIADILDINAGFTVDILNINEVPQSCRNVIFACVDQDNPLLEELLSGGSDGDSDDDDFSANVASFEYGINNAIPHSKGGELLCPGNTTSEGFVSMNFQTFWNRDGQEFVGYIGLNNGNGRGSLDSFWFQNGTFLNGQFEPGG
jgi:hypothetical protein